MKEPLRLLPQSSFYQRLNQSISDRAQSEVDMDFYILEKDRATTPFFESIDQAARRGVKFQVHMDHFIALKPSAFLAAYRAYRHLKKLQREGLPVEVRKTIRQTGDTTRNPVRRSHKKVAIIDGATENGHAYVGGSNLAGRFLPWRDSMVETGADAAKALQQDFRLTWNRQNGGFHRYSVDDETEILSDSKRSDGIQKRVLSEIAQAKERIWLETTYLDSGRIQKALIAAKGQNPNLDVQVLAPHPSVSNDPRYRFLPGRLLNPLADAGITVQLYGRKAKQFSHAKTLIIDNAAMTGSTNFADEVFAGGDAEILLLSRNSQFIKEAEVWFKGGLEHAERYQRKQTRR